MVDSIKSKWLPKSRFSLNIIYKYTRKQFLDYSGIFLLNLQNKFTVYLQFHLIILIATKWNAALNLVKKYIRLLIAQANRPQ